METDADANSIEDKVLDDQAKLPPIRRRKPEVPRVLSGRSLYTLTLLAMAFLLLVVYSFKLRQQDVNACNMSYMYPSYRRLHGFDLEHTRFAPKYSLYLYREQTIDISEEPQGVPVLFVPGNAGSYKQIRPIAAEAAAQFQQSLKMDPEILRQGKRSLDFFTVDFNEDFSAFHGQTMLDQAEYLNSAITYVLSMYTDARKSPSDRSLPDPTSVIIIGHSMGGIVARLMQLMPNYLPKSINTIITISTPHAIPPAPFDPQIQSIYEQVNTFWRESFSAEESHNTLQDVTMISIAGGGLDTIVSSDYTSVKAILPPSNGFTVYTSTIPNVWISADHQAILWCDQFRKVLAATLLQVVDARRGSQTMSTAGRMNIFAAQFLSNLDRGHFTPTLANQRRRTIRVRTSNSDAETSFVKNRKLFRTLTTKSEGSLDLMPLTGASDLSLQLLTNVPAEQSGSTSFMSISMCRRENSPPQLVNDEDLELSCIDVTKDVTILPSRQDLRKTGSYTRLYFLQYNQGSFLGHDFLAVRLMTQEPTHFVAAELVSSSTISEISASVDMFSLFFGGVRIILDSSRALSSVVKIHNTLGSLIAYKLNIDHKPCHEQRIDAVTRQHTSAPYETKYFVGKDSIDISLHGLAPFFPVIQSQLPSLTIQHWADPNCPGPLDITLSVDYLGSLGKLVMRYRVVLVAFPLALALIVVWTQLSLYNRTGVFVSFQQAQRHFLRQSLLYVLVVVSTMSIVLAGHQQMSSVSLESYFSHDDPSQQDRGYIMFLNDKLLGLQDPFFWWLAPLFVLTSVGVLNFVSIVLTTGIHLTAAIVSFVKQNSSSSIEQSAARSLRRRLITTAVLLTFVSFAIPYQFAYIVACTVQMSTCIRLVRSLDSNRTIMAYNFNFAMLILMVCVLPINIPILVVWIRNMSVQWFTPFSSHHNILSIAPIILLVESLTNGQMFPPISSHSDTVLGLIIFTMAALVCVYGVMYTYMLHQIMNVLAGFIFLYQHFAIHVVGATLEDRK